MADAVITFFLENLTKILSHEADLLLGVEDEARSLQDELKLTQSFLRSFKERRNDQGPIAEFINQIRDAVHEAEDIIDKYVAGVAQRRGDNLFVRTIFKLYQKVARREVAEKIRGVKRRFRELYEYGERVGIQLMQLGDLPMEDESSQRSRRLPIEETDVVGFDTEAKMIIKRLTEGEARRDVVPIVGMGGIGKTTLARKVYNDPIVTDYFNFRAWVYVSQEYKVKELLLAIIKCAFGLTEDMKDMSEDELGLELRKYLRSTRYLIVLDDVWKTQFWEELNQIFAKNMFGSRIILTTRNKGVALHANPSCPPHYLRFLNEEESWQLFSLKVFPHGKCPSELEGLGKQMAEKCRGLPLAIVVLAGVLLKKEKTHRWWLKVSSSVSSILSEHTDQCAEILALSYNNLPLHLRPCFLYLGLFPEDFEIPARLLVRLWLAEGFVQQKDQEVMEDVGEEYLEELVDRNLIQAAKRRFDGGIKTCRIHDLLRDLCITKAKQEKFLEVRHSSSPSGSRRLAIHSNILNYISLNPSASNLRSLLCFGLDGSQQLSLEQWKFLYKGYTLVRVLDLWGVGVDIIPNEIDKLIHLRYLRLKSLTAQTLPVSICNLWNLQTLEVIAPCIDRHEIGIWKMHQLRHLYFRGQAVLPQPPTKMLKDRSNRLSNLQTLSSISPDSCTEDVFCMVPNLLKLGIYGDLEGHMDIAFKNLFRLNCLQNLKLERDRRCRIMISLQNWVKFPPNLTKLTLSETQLSVDPMMQLGQLPNLQVLKLKNAAYSGRVLACYGFPKLQVLKLVNLAVGTWNISIGSLLSLRSVVINRCGNLVGLPDALQKMPAFQELELWSPHVSVVKEAREIEMLRGKEQFKLLIYQSETK